MIFIPAYNEENNITPRQIQKEIGKIKLSGKTDDHEGRIYDSDVKKSIAADPVIKYMTKAALEKAVKNSEKKMYKAAEELNFTEAARLRDEIVELKKLINENRLSKYL